jgi:hypothetical protein
MKHTWRRYTVAGLSTLVLVVYSFGTDFGHCLCRHRTLPGANTAWVFDLRVELVSNGLSVIFDVGDQSFLCCSSTDLAGSCSLWCTHTFLLFNILIVVGFQLTFHRRRRARYVAVFSSTALILFRRRSVRFVSNRAEPASPPCAEDVGVVEPFCSRSFC